MVYRWNSRKDPLKLEKFHEQSTIRYVMGGIDHRHYDRQNKFEGLHLQECSLKNRFF